MLLHVQSLKFDLDQSMKCPAGVVPCTSRRHAFRFVRSGQASTRIVSRRERAR